MSLLVIIWIRRCTIYDVNNFTFVISNIWYFYVKKMNGFFKKRKINLKIKLRYRCFYHNFFYSIFSKSKIQKGWYLQKNSKCVETAKDHRWLHMKFRQWFHTYEHLLIIFYNSLKFVFFETSLLEWKNKNPNKICSNMWHMCGLAFVTCLCDSWKCTRK